MFGRGLIYIKVFLFFAAVSAFTGALYSQYLQSYFDAPASITLWRQLEPGENLAIGLYDDFEERVSWKITVQHAIEPIIRFVQSKPVDADVDYFPDQVVVGAWEKELELLQQSAKIHNSPVLNEQRFSQELQFFVSRPGLDYAVIEPDEKFKHDIHDRPIAVSIWVYGSGKWQALYFLFSSVHHNRIPVKIADMNFYGWRRFEVIVPPFLQERNKRDQNRYRFRIEGLKLVSSSHGEKGLCSVAFDMITYLVEVDKLQKLPGADISDQWDQ